MWEENPRVTHHLSAPSDYGPPEALATLKNAGCRALPSLISRLDESKDPKFLGGLTDRIIMELAEQSWEEMALLSERSDAWFIYEEDSFSERRVKCERIQGWWRDNGSRYYQWWRFWSSQCRG